MGSKLGRGFRTPANQAVGIIDDGSYYFAAFEDNTLIYRNGDLALTLSTKQTRNTVSLTNGDIITSNKPISMSRSGAGVQGLFYAWSGKRFAFYKPRYTITSYIRAVGRTANVNIYYNAALVSTETVTSREVTAISTNVNGAKYIIESDEDIVVYKGELTSADCKPLYPATEIIYGTASNTGYLIGLEDSTSYTLYRSDGTSSSGTVNRGGLVTFSGGSSQFSGDSHVIVADKPVAAHSYADSDGGEMTPFMGERSFGKRFIIPEDEREFVKFVSNKPATLTFTAEDGTALGTNALSGSTNGGGIYEYYATGTKAYENVLITSDEPVCAVVEGDADDEQVLMADVFHDAADYGEGDGFSVGRKVVTEGLAFMVDASNNKSRSSGTQWKDRSGNKNHGTLVNGASRTDDKKMAFDGSNDYASFSVTKTATCTFAVWAKSSETSTSSINDMLFVAGTAGSGPDLWFSGGGIYWNVWDGYGNKICDMPSNVADGKFHYYVLVCDADADTATLYMDGESIGSGTHGSTQQTRMTDDTTLTLGGGSGGYIWKGEIADFKMYNKKLSTREIVSNYKQKKRKVQGR